jgi:predicted DsbA family dithiol-disulfide isomerase
VALERMLGPGRAAAAQEWLPRFAAQFGVEIRPPGRVWNTRRALAASELARDQGRLDAFRTAAMDAYWLAGREIESDAGIAAVARAAGVPAEAAVAAAGAPEYLARVDAARAEAHERGVSGIPTFFFGEMVVVGCQPYEALARVARRAGARERAR